MGRPVVLSNGHLFVGLNESGTVDDFYYPYVGEENLTNARYLNHKIGVWKDNAFTWLDDGSWQISMDFGEDALVSEITAKHPGLNVELHFNDFVDAHYPAFCRNIEVKNLDDKDAHIRLFLHQAFQISPNGRSDTALYVPLGHYILDYKGRCCLLIYAQDEAGQPFDEFAVGNTGIEGKEGTFRDAEDGSLSGSAVEHGGVDSVVRLSLDLPANGVQKCKYWVVAADSQHDAEAIHKNLLSKGLDSRLESTKQSFEQWMAVAQPKLNQIPEKYRTFAKKSLLVVKAHIDRHGGILASGDSSIYNYGRDYYSYVWPRDGAYAIMPLIELGFKDEPRRFFDFCADTMHKDGYMMHKYQPDRSIGSTWHPLLHRAYPELPIQEDETATVICSLARYLEVSGDEEFVQGLYDRFVKPMGDFMTKFIDDATNLPHASYDLWEQKFATFTYTVFMTVKALKAAAAIAERFGRLEDKSHWSAAAMRILDGQRLLLNDAGAYRKSLFLTPEGNLEFDNTIDAATFFGVLQYESNVSDNLRATVSLVESILLNSAPIGGVPRYEHDDYFLRHSEMLGNPWMITTLWLAGFYIKDNQLSKAEELIDWVMQRATDSGMLSEQVDPVTGFGIGVSPLVWSHSTFVETVLMLP